jgi:hypothetical protein
MPLFLAERRREGGRVFTLEGKGREREIALTLGKREGRGRERESTYLGERKRKHLPVRERERGGEELSLRDEEREHLP